MDPMGRSPLPSGRYLSITIDVHPDYGGQTRALLMRNRIFAAHGASPDVLFVGPAPDLEWRRQTLRERRLLTEGIDLLNIYEHYRDTDWPGDSPTGEALPDLGAHLRREETLPDGSPWRRTYKLGEGRKVFDYLRPDGSTYIRMPDFVFKEPETWPTDIVRVSRDGEALGTYRSPSGWYRRWLRDLAGAQRAFVFLDSRFLAPLVAPMKAPNIHLAYLMHNTHVRGERRWDSETSPAYTRALGVRDGLDAFVTLTERQREDIAQRIGPTSNLHVVPNPVDLPPVPPVVERDPRLVTVVARIEAQKRLSHAVKAFRHVVDELPDARLDIYGSGSHSAGIQRVIDRLDLGDSVTLKGHDPHARESLWRSSAFLMTSLFEGYPLSTLESMSHGCPVVSYDIKYGPREQITDGEDGFLVPEGDAEAMGRRVVELLRDPDLVRRMSKAAQEKAAAHGYDRFLTDWVRVLDATVAAKRHRTRIEKADLSVRRLSVGRDRGRPGPVGERRRLRFDASLQVRGKGDLSTAEVSLAAVHEGSGLVVDLPVSTRRHGDTIRVRTSTPLAALWPEDAAARDRCRLRLRLVWANSSWQTHVTRPAGGRTGLEVGYGTGEEWVLTRR